MLGLDDHRASGGEQLQKQDRLVLWETTHYNGNIPCMIVPWFGEGTSHVPSNPMSGGVGGAGHCDSGDTSARGGGGGRRDSGVSGGEREGGTIPIQRFSL